MSAVFSAQNFIRKLLVLISEVQGWSCPASWWGNSEYVFAVFRPPWGTRMDCKIDNALRHQQFVLYFFLTRKME